MKTTLHYSERMTLCVHALGMCAHLDMGCKPLNEVLDFVEHIFGNDTLFNGEWVNCVHVINSDTGELIAECEPDLPPIDDDCDWDFNEDMGYDPYMGCYTDDC